MSKLVLIFFLLSLAFNQKTQAEVLLIPHQNYPDEVYQTECQKNGYLCVQDYYLQRVLSAETPKYDQFIQNMDLLNKNFLENLADDVSDIIRNESINLEQVDHLQSVMDQALKLKDNPKLVFISNQLKKARQIVRKSEENLNDTLVVFKTKISQEFYKKNKIDLINLAVFEVSNFNLPRKLNTQAIPLLTGSCDQPKYAPGVLKSSLQLQPLFADSCGFSQAVSQSLHKSQKFVTENKKTILLSALAVGAIWFFNKYQVQVSF